MAITLFVTQNDIKANSIVSGSVDPDKFLQFVKIAQEIHIQNYLGTKLYERIQLYVTNNGSQNGTFSGDDTDPEKILLDKFVKDMTLYWAMVDYIKVGAFEITNKGVLRHTSETAELASIQDLDYLTNKYRDLAQYYTKQFIDFMPFNQTTYPEYNTNTNNDRYPSRDSYFGGMQL
jgi:hypothetical protein